MVKVSPTLINRHLKEEKLRRAYRILEEDVEIQTLLKMSNIMAVTRLKYNDHGPIHSKITAGAALEILEIISGRRTPSAIIDHGFTYEDSKIITLMGAYLHDIGNAVHRADHHIHGCILMNGKLDEILNEIYGEEEKRIRVKCEILHCIYSHDENVQCLSLEAGIVKVADGTDMAEGRARIPYDLGKRDIHSISALAIRRVEIERGLIKPIRIIVTMENPAGIFQVQNVLQKKIATSGLEDEIEIVTMEVEE
ncbi:MAG TPA: HD domain-containing protein [Candidatus Bathyarchaeota archaeon]|nr:HD domain-containing protein [Candidatus Bathyarchaeota archaeon]